MVVLVTDVSGRCSGSCFVLSCRHFQVVNDFVLSVSPVRTFTWVLEIFLFSWLAVSCETVFGPFGVGSNLIRSGQPETWETHERHRCERRCASTHLLSFSEMPLTAVPKHLYVYITYDQELASRPLCYTAEQPMAGDHTSPAEVHRVLQRSRTGFQGAEWEWRRHRSPYCQRSIKMILKLLFLGEIEAQYCFNLH